MPTQTYNWGLTDMPITLEQNATLKHINIRKEGPADDTALNNLLAEGQAREKVLRDATEGLIEQSWNHDRIGAACAALAQPADYTALRAALKAERERCIYACMQGDYEYKTAQECVEDIGALGDE